MKIGSKFLEEYLLKNLNNALYEILNMLTTGLNKHVITNFAFTIFEYEYLILLLSKIGKEIN